MYDIHVPRQSRGVEVFLSLPIAWI